MHMGTAVTFENYGWNFFHSNSKSFPWMLKEGLLDEGHNSAAQFLLWQVVATSNPQAMLIYYYIMRSDEGRDGLLAFSKNSFEFQKTTANF